MTKKKKNPIITTITDPTRIMKPGQLVGKAPDS